ncbi:G patch domain-containing protein 4 [Rhea pennata]|uniref:G patch domain-containing protein 4 n=1 Tax=Rhea pennata TaxID=8795 RepID=UPI002E277508
MSPPEPPEPPGRGMRFAESQLRRHGWKRGKGLGKREDGIAEAIKVKVKCDATGVGHDPAEQFSFHWWDHVFNKSAANIAVETGQDGVSVKTLSEQDAEISNKKPRKACKADGMLYGRFVKAATLTACGEEAARLPAASESSEEEEEKLDLSSARRLTDEELIQACGGRTAHKGARHGVTMSAKLARLEEQERAFLAAYRQKKGLLETPESSPPAERQKKAKKKKKKQSKDRADPEAEQSQEPSGEENTVEEEKITKRKKKKKQHKELAERGESETEAPLGEADEADHAGHSPKKKRKRRHREAE